jgi:hypothetical protein
LNVYNGTTFLEGISLLGLRVGKAHIRKALVVGYDVLHITVPLSAQVMVFIESIA